MASEVIKRVNGRLFIDGYDVTDCPKLKYADSYNPDCSDSGSLTCHGRPNCLFKQLIDKNRELDEANSLNKDLTGKVEKFERQLNFYKDLSLDLLIEQREQKHARKKQI